MRTPPAPPRSAHPKRQSQFRIQRDAVGRVPRRRGALRHEDDRKLKPLRRMHREKTHCMRVALLDDVGVRFACFVVREPPYLRDERAHVPAVQLMLPREPDQLLHVRDSLLAVQTTRDCRQEIGLRKHCLEQRGWSDPVALALHSRHERNESLQRGRG